MVDLNKNVAAALKNIARVELEFPEVGASLPLITITETTNLTEYEVDGSEAISLITYQVDVWDERDQRQRCEQNAILVSDALSNMGFRRIGGRGFTDEGLSRKMMYFEIKVINKEEGE